MYMSPSELLAQRIRSALPRFLRGATDAMTLAAVSVSGVAPQALPAIAVGGFAAIALDADAAQAQGRRCIDAINAGDVANCPATTTVGTTQGNAKGAAIRIVDVTFTNAMKREAIRENALGAVCLRLDDAGKIVAQQAMGANGCYTYYTQETRTVAFHIIKKANIKKDTATGLTDGFLGREFEVPTLTVNQGKDAIASYVRSKVKAAGNPNYVECPEEISGTRASSTTNSIAAAPPPPPPPAAVEAAPHAPAAELPTPTPDEVTAKPSTSGLYLAGGIALTGNKSKTGKAISGGVAQGNVNITGGLDGTARAIVGRSGTDGKISLREAAAGAQIRINRSLLAGVEVGLLGAGTTPVTTATPFAFNPALAGQSDTSRITNGLGIRPTIGAQIGDSTRVSASFATTSLFGGQDKERFNQFNLSLQRDGRLSAGVVVTPLLNIQNRDDIIGIDSKGKGIAAGINYDLNGKPNGLDVGLRAFYGDTKTTVAAVRGLTSTTSEFTINPALGITKGKIRLEVSPSYTFADTKNTTPRSNSSIKNNEARVMFNFSVRLGNAPLPSVSAGYGDTAAKIDAWNERYSGKGGTVRRLSPEQASLAGIDDAPLGASSAPTGQDFKQPNGLTLRQQTALQNLMNAVQHEDAAGCKANFTSACAATGVELAKVMVQQANAGGDNAVELQSYLEQNPIIQDIGLGKINLAGTMGGVILARRP